MKIKQISRSVFSGMFLYLILLTIPSCVDVLQTDSLSGTPRFASGPSNGSGYTLADGIIHASGEIFGVFMTNTETASSVDTAAKLVNSSAYMGFVQEDIFRYSKDKYLAQYLAAPATAEKKYLKISSQLKALMAVYKRNLYLLVNTGSVAGVTDIKGLAAKSSLKINLGALDSDTYISAKSVTDAYTFTSPDFKTDDAVTGIEKVVSGEYNAAFIIDDSPSSLLAGIAQDAAVELIAVNMPEGKKYYNEDGTIFQGEYKFQGSTVSSSVMVKTVLACSPSFEERLIEVFIEYVLSHTGEYTVFNQEWGNVTKTMTAEFITKNPHNCNYRALCYFMGSSPVDPINIEPNLCSAESMSGSHDMAVDLIYLLSRNLDVDLKEKNTTGTWENSYWMLNGGATMALVSNDIFSYLAGFEDSYSILQSASMKKIAPLNYEYVHLAINANADWSAWGLTSPLNRPPANLQELLTNKAGLQVLKINVGPKTSGTFMSAMKIINSYKTFDSADSDTTPDMEQIEIHYSFDSASDSIVNLKNGDYHAAFVTTGVPYNRFYPHDTYTLPANIRLIPALFYNNVTPYPYQTGKIAGNAADGNYPYRAALLPSASIDAVRLRSLLVVSPAAEFDLISRYIKSIYLKAFYRVYTLDPGNPDYSLDPLWIPVMIDSYSASGSAALNSADYETYGEAVVGAKEYFVREPFGWDKNSAEYYLSLFPDNE